MWIAPCLRASGLPGQSSDRISSIRSPACFTQAVVRPVTMPPAMYSITTFFRGDQLNVSMMRHWRCCLGMADTSWLASTLERHRYEQSPASPDCGRVHRHHCGGRLMAARPQPKEAAKAVASAVAEAEKMQRIQGCRSVMLHELLPAGQITPGRADRSVLQGDLGGHDRGGRGLQGADPRVG